MSLNKHQPMRTLRSDLSMSSVVSKISTTKKLEIPLEEDEDTVRISGGGGGDVDMCGYAMGENSGVDTRNTKYQARKNGNTTLAASNKSFNYKSIQKYHKRRDAKMTREATKAEKEEAKLKEKEDALLWGTMDKVEERREQREATKRAKDEERAMAKQMTKEAQEREERE